MLYAFVYNILQDDAALRREMNLEDLDSHPTVTSKMLLPTELDTAISPYPFRATITLVMRSGMLVPAARNVRPITSGGMATVSPATFAHQTIRYEYAAIQKIEPMNVIGKNFFPEIKRMRGIYYLPRIYIN
ncbi:hypothetical protein RF55_4519 [Lasius niger]|uniref:Uncharacterized protein n=1 Tax=Lasius niger TaxID=67767 RepID=A0A0J7NS48_LASNI|nr:hypothetical protein RF55_4519 [Lasius niger]